MRNRINFDWARVERERQRAKLASIEAEMDAASIEAEMDAAEDPAKHSQIGIRSASKHWLGQVNASVRAVFVSV